MNLLSRVGNLFEGQWDGVLKLGPECLFNLRLNQFAGAEDFGCVSDEVVEQIVETGQNIIGDVVRDKTTFGNSKWRLSS